MAETSTVAAWNGIGLARLLAERYSEAVEAFLRALAANQSQPEVLFNLGLARYRLQQRDLAEQDFSNSAQAAKEAKDVPVQVAALYMSALILKERDKFPEALEIAQKALKLSRETDYDTLILVSGICLSLSKNREAENYARKAIVLEGQDPDGHYNLACALARDAARLEETKSVLQRAFELKPELLDHAKIDPDLEHLKEWLATRSSHA